MTNAIETSSLGKRFRSNWALRDCDVTVPDGAVCALIGPNGAGKTTLLQLLAGLSRPSDGAAIVFGRATQQEAAFLADVGFLAQEVPLYRRFSTADHLAMGAHLNPRWDDSAARSRLATLGIPLDRPVGRLSGGQRAQVALAVALSKKPRLLLFDEPVAALDPLARSEFLATLQEANREGVTILMSSHLVSDLERVCDHVVLLAAGRTELCGAVERLLAEQSPVVGDGSLEALIVSIMSKDAARVTDAEGRDPLVPSLRGATGR